MENIYITSDIHYSHKNIVGGITKWRNEQGEIPSDRVRNFETLEDMNYALVDNINKVIEVFENYRKVLKNEKR